MKETYTIILPKCKKCIYLNEKGNCWAIKGKANPHNFYCDYRPIKPEGL